MLTVRGCFDLHPFFGMRELLPLPLWRYRYTNQDRCEGVLSVLMAIIDAVNCTSIHFLVKQKSNYALLSFEEKFT